MSTNNDQQQSSFVGAKILREMSDEVTSENPYSRLMALQRMNVVSDYRKIRTLSIAVVGIGGVGSVTAEMLTRCGVGKLLVFDFDTVENANMNRMFFTPDHIGLKKTDAAKKVLEFINPDVAISSFHMNITSVQNYPKFVEILSKANHKEDGPVDLVLGCVDNYEARISVNAACLELNIPWYESGVSENGISGHIQLCVPGVTPCFDCAPPLVVITGQEKAMKREGVCAASLPTVNSIIAGLLVQNTLKLLLSFGEPSKYLGFNSLMDFFPKDNLAPNPECRNKKCVEHQEQAKESGYSQRFFHPSKKNQQIPITHSENEFQICVVKSSENDENMSTDKNNNSAPCGTQWTWEPSKNDHDEDENAFVETEEVEVGGLMDQLKKLGD